MSMKTLDPLSEHLSSCPQCYKAFAQYRDSDYCDVGKPLFDAWHADNES